MLIKSIQCAAPDSLFLYGSSGEKREGAGEASSTNTFYQCKTLSISNDYDTVIHYDNIYMNISFIQPLPLSPLLRS